MRPHAHTAGPIALVVRSAGEAQPQGAFPGIDDASIRILQGRIEGDAAAAQEALVTEGRRGGGIGAAEGGGTAIEFEVAVNIPQSADRAPWPVDGLARVGRNGGGHGRHQGLGAAAPGTFHAQIIGRQPQAHKESDDRHHHEDFQHGESAPAVGDAGLLRTHRGFIMDGSVLRATRADVARSVKTLLDQ